MKTTEEQMEAAVARARQALASGSGVEVNTRVRLLAMLQALFEKCQAYHAQIDMLNAELAALRQS